MTQTTIPHITLNDGKTMPQLGLGVWQASDDEAEQAVTAAIKAGYRLIDTAAMYKNERGVGRAIAASEVPREELFVTTKLWNADQGYDSAMKAFDKSLDSLGLEYIDLYLIHWPMPKNDKFVETWRAFEELWASGKVRSIGVSNFHVPHLEKLLASTDHPPAVNQIEVHADFQQTEVREFCKQHNIAVESWSPIGGQGSHLLEDDVVKNIATKYGKSPAQVAIRWHIDNGLVVIPKSVHEERIIENADVFNFKLDQEDLDALAKLDGDNRVGPNPDTSEFV